MKEATHGQKVNSYTSSHDRSSQQHVEINCYPWLFAIRCCDVFHFFFIYSSNAPATRNLFMHNIYLSSLRGESNQTPNLSWHFHSYVNKIQHWIVWGNALAGICEHNDQLQDEYMSWQHASHSYSTSFPHKSDILLGLICGTWSVTCLMSSRTQFMWCPLG